MEVDAQTNIEKAKKDKIHENSLFNYKALNKHTHKGSSGIYNIVIYRAVWLQESSAVWKKI